MTDIKETIKLGVMTRHSIAASAVSSSQYEHVRPSHKKKKGKKGKDRRMATSSRPPWAIEYYPSLSSGAKTL